MNLTNNIQILQSYILELKHLIMNRYYPVVIEEEKIQTGSINQISSSIEQKLEEKLDQLKSTQNKLPIQGYNDTKIKFKFKGILKTILLIFFLSLTLAILMFQFPNVIQFKNQVLKLLHIQGTKISKIVWIYTNNEIETQKTDRIIYFYYLKQISQRSGYEVRAVNSWNAYDWLTKETILKITHAMQNKKIDQSVDNLLKLALLIQNGGIMIGDLDTIFFNEDFRWIEEMFESSSFTYQHLFSCNPTQANVFLIQTDDQIFKTKYLQNFIIARPKSTLLKQALEILIKIIKTGTIQNEFLKHALHYNRDNKINSFPNSLQNAISLAIYNSENPINKPQHKKTRCQTYGLQTSKMSNVLDNNYYTQEQKKAILLNETNQSFKIDLIVNAKFKSMETQLFKILYNHQNIKLISKDSIFYRLLSAPGNRQIFLQPLQERNIQLCLIVLNDLNQTQINNVSQAYHSQTFKNWKLVVFAKNIEESSQLQNKNIYIVQSRYNRVHNIEKAATKYCNPKSYAVLLNYGEMFNDNNALEIISKSLKPRHIVGAAIDLDFKGETLSANRVSLNFSRSRDALNDPKIGLMEGILNHFRIFSIEVFRYIPQFDLRNMFNNYFQDRILFLTTMLELINNPKSSVHTAYMYKKYASFWDIPQKIIVINSTTTILVNSLQKINLKQLQVNQDRLNAQPISQTIQYALNYKIPLTSLITLNNGDDFVSVNQKTFRKIPKIIHQIWLDGPLPPIKKYLFNKTKAMYPQYQMKLWKDSNITREDFPLTYDVIMNLVDFYRFRKIPYHQSTKIIDLMKYQILYYEGGIWRDINMNVFHPIFDKFLNYKLVIGIQQTFKHRWNQKIGFIAQAPTEGNMLQKISYPSLNRMNIYTNLNHIQDSVNFDQIGMGNLENNPQILILSAEYFSPAKRRSTPDIDLCTKWKETLNESDSVQFEDNQCVLLTNCQQKYPYAVGISHSCFDIR